MDKNISYNITEACKKCGIEYKSVNPNFVTFTNDAQLLGQLYKDLIEIAGKLGEISHRHDNCGLNVELEKTIAKIGEIDHDLVKLATKILEEEKC
jgi:hypothetical protein